MPFTRLNSLQNFTHRGKPRKSILPRESHSSQPFPASSSTESHLQSTGKRESQQVFLKSLYPPGDRKENIPSERLVTHIKGDKSLHLHLHGPGIRRGPVPLSSACRGRTTGTFQALTETERKCSRANNTSPCQGIFHF